VDVVLGSASMSVRDCLRLQPDTIVRLSQSAGEDLIVQINGVSVARAEVMIVEDSTAVRVTDIVPPPSSEIVQ
jgi:flagellar motor switch protein FliN/FliY